MLAARARRFRDGGGTPQGCVPLKQQLDGIEAEIRALQDELDEASPAEKPAIIAAIREARWRAAEVEAELNACISAPGACQVE